MMDKAFLPDNLLVRLGKRLASNDAELKKSVDQLTDAFGDVTFLAQHYIQPHVQLELPGEETTGTCGPVFGHLNEFFADDHPGNLLFVLGDAGTGKASLLIMLKLTHLAGLVASHHDCLMLRLEPTTVENISKLRAPRKTILLLDASTAKPDQIAAVLQASRRLHRVVIASRSTHVASVNCKALYLSSFNDTPTDKYLKRRFQRMKDANRKRAKGILKAMGVMGGRPLWLNHMDSLVHSRRKAWDVFAAYETLVEAWLEQEQRRQAKGWKKEEALQACIAVAMTGEASEIMKSLEIKGRSLLRKDRKGRYRFTHSSIREYLVALGMKLGVRSGKERLTATQLIIDLLGICDDSAVSWQTLDLTGMSLAGITLHDANFRKAMLDDTDLTGSAFLRATFGHTMMEACAANEAKFDACTFDGCKAAHAVLRGATFSGTRLANTLLPGSVFRSAQFESCDFYHTLLADGDFRRATFGKCTLHDCSFKASALAGASFRDSKLSKVRMDQCELAGTSFQGCDLQELSVKDADMRGAELDQGFLAAIKSGAVQHWKTATWDPEVAGRLESKRKR